MSRNLIIVLTLLLSNYSILVTPLPGIGDIQTYYNFANDCWGVFNGDLPITALFTGSTGPTLDKILASAQQLSGQLADFGTTLDKKLNNLLSQVMNTLPLQGKIQASMRELHKYITRVDSLYENFEYYNKNRTNFNELTIRRFLTRLTSLNGEDLQDTLDRMHRLLVPGRTSAFTEGIMSLVSQEIKMQGDNVPCSRGVSPQMRIYEIYDAISITESRGYLMAMFAYSLLTVYQNKTHHGEMNKLRDQLISRTDDYLIVTAAAMKGLPRDIVYCDAVEYERDVTYTELSGALQIYLVNMAALDPIDRECDTHCDQIKVAAQGECNDLDDPICLSKICHGTVFDCTYRGGSDFSICEDESEDSPRRYIYYQDGLSHINGNSSEDCPNELSKLYNIKPVRQNCNTCVCTCSEENAESTAVRAINLDTRLSDSYNNFVVTGLRFVERGKMIHIQIKEGRLLPNGRIDMKSQRWQKLPEYEYQGQGDDEPEFYEDGELMNSGSYVLIRREERAVKLDDIVVPYRHVITGVYLYEQYDELLEFDNVDEVNKGYGNYIQLGVIANSFDFSTGEIDIEPNYITLEFMSENGDLGPEYEKTRKEIDITDGDNPAKSTSNPDISRINSEIRFMPSSNEKDAGQSTIPFLDIRPVQPRPPMPLAGIGLMHRGSEGYGGFLHFRLLNLDISKYVTATLKQENGVEVNAASQEQEDYDYQK